LAGAGVTTAVVTERSPARHGRVARSCQQTRLMSSHRSVSAHVASGRRDVRGLAGNGLRSHQADRARRTTPAAQFEQRPPLVAAGTPDVRKATDFMRDSGRGARRPTVLIGSHQESSSSSLESILVPSGYWVIKAYTGAQALERKDWQEARKRFVTATSLYPDYDLAYNGLGVAAMNAGDAEGARRAFEKALLLSENFAEANRNLARILLAEQKNSEALPLLKRSLSTEPENAWALTHAAYVELMLHDFGNALLDAYDATNVASLLFRSPASGSGAAGVAVKFTVPTVANGKVYVGGQTSFTVFGLLP